MHKPINLLITVEADQEGKEWRAIVTAPDFTEAIWSTQFCDHPSRAFEIAADMIAAMSVDFFYAAKDGSVLNRDHSGVQKMERRVGRI